MRARAAGDPTLCREILEGLDFDQDGFCKLVRLKPTKEGGYVQVSYGGANKFVMLQELVLWSEGVTLVSGQQCSHRCGKPLCKERHICAESAELNNRRKGCAVVLKCNHCQKMILICQHDPVCITNVPGWASWEDFLQNGLCI
jgi:hypothetical protein